MRVVFLVVGAEKAEILRAVLRRKADPPYPAQLVQPRDQGKNFFWLIKPQRHCSGLPIQPGGAQGKPAATSRGETGETAMILAGDIGGTKCNLALYEISRWVPPQIVDHRYESREFPAFDRDLEISFRNQSGNKAAGAHAIQPRVLASRGRSSTGASRPRICPGSSMPPRSHATRHRHVVLLNDLEATAHSCRMCPHRRFSLSTRHPFPAIHAGPDRGGNRLGEAILFWDGERMCGEHRGRARGFCSAHGTGNRVAALHEKAATNL